MNDPFHFRLARRDESLLLNHIEADCGQLFRSVEGYEWVDARINLAEDHWGATIDAGTCWAAADAETDAPIGFLAAERFDDDIYICEIGVLTRYQGQKIGSALIRLLEVYARDANLRAITLTTFTDIPWNGPFYERRGFVALDQNDMPTYLRAKLHDEAARGLMRKPRAAMERRVRCG